VRRIKILSRALWGLNALLTAALLAFTARYLVAAPKVDPLRDLDLSAAAASPPRPAPEAPSEDALIHLRNPLQKTVRPTPPPPDLALKGALPASHSGNGTAFIHSKAGHSDTIARMGEPILRNGKPAPEFAGWLLSDLGKDFAVFTNREGERFALEIESLLPSDRDGDPHPPSRLGEAYRSESYRSRLLAFTDNREIWGIDENELDWAAQNLRQFLDRDIQISPSAGGGLRIDSLSPGSMPAARGVKLGDVLREVNGRPLSSLSELQAILSNPPKSGLQLTLERAGKSLVIEYRPLPR
jgi:hypothetical protein